MERDFRAGFASYTFSTLFANLTKLAKNEIIKILSVNAELRKLDRMLLKIQEMVDIVEYSRADFPVNMQKKSWIAWTEEANRLIYNISDLFEDVSLELGLREGEKLEGKGLIKNLMLSKPHKISGFVVDLQNLVKEMEMEMVSFVDLTKHHQLVVRKQHYTFSSSVNQTLMIGRADQMREVVEILINEDVPICITGMRGIGKSVFTQCLCDSKEVTSAFSQKIWISNAVEFDSVRIMKSVIEFVSEKSCDLMDLGTLTSTLKELLSEKTLLVVVDDYDAEYYEDWSMLYATLKFVAQKSRVIITTRNSKVAYVADAKMFHLSPLSDEDCWEIMKQRPYLKNQLHNLEVVGIELAKKCRGLPAVAKTIGDILQCLPDKEWNSVLKCNLWELPQIKNYIVPNLLLDYCALPPQLKKCFSYFSLFPPGCEYELDKTVLLWMAEGLIHPISGRRNEDIGREYFKELIYRSFLNSPNEDPHGFTGVYKMHDLIHHMALLVSSNIFQRIEDTNSYHSPDSIRHLSMCLGDAQSMDLKKFPKCDKLWTFLWLCGNDVPIGQNVSNLFDMFKIIRVLDLESSGIIEVPESIGTFRHLRYLDLSGNSIRTLPETICKLFCLQVLILKNCTLLDCLPENFNKLTKLQHFYFEVKNQIHRMPINFRFLVNLRCLDGFIVGTEEGYTIEELKTLMFLSGSICITGLENISSQEQAATALLNDKQDIQKLELVWRSSQNVNSQDGVLIGLQPHENLQELIINNYYGNSFPPWISNRQTCRLKFVHLRRCQHCNTLPPLGKLQFLEHLVIERMPLLTKAFPRFIGSGDFPSLKSLSFVEMSELAAWVFFIYRGMPQLRDLKFSDCPKLTHLPEFFELRSLENIELSGCQLLCYLPGMPASAKSIVIWNCPMLKRHCQVGGSYWHKLSTLRSAQVDGVEIPKR